MSAIGPEEGMYMHESLIKFVWTFVESSSLVCPHKVDPADCHTALDFFGFGPTADLKMLIQEDDPLRVGKIMRYRLQVMMCNHTLYRVCEWALFVGI